MKALIILLLLVSAPALAEHRIIVGEFKNASESKSYEDLSKAYPDLLSACLSQNPELEILERGYLEYIANEQANRNEVYKLEAADYIVSGTISNDGSADILVIDAITSEVKYSTNISDELADCRERSQQIVGKLDAVSKEKTAIDINPKRNKIFISATSSFHNGDYNSAIASFMKITSDYPEDADAKYWLIKSYKKSGMEDLSQIEAGEFLKQFPNHKLAKELREVE